MPSIIPTILRSTAAAAIALTALGGTIAYAGHHGGEAHANQPAMSADNNIVENASNSPVHTTLVAAVVQAGLVDTLSGPGPFTVFAPTNDAFGQIPADTVNALMQDAARAQLTQILTYHVVAGSVDAASLIALITDQGGEATLTTVEGSLLTASIIDGSVALTDETGGVSYVTQADLPQSNGFIHVVNGVLLPDFSADSQSD
jgi:uncharacterized surface protein with fasciclin (FAS1) repeats